MRKYFIYCKGIDDKDKLEWVDGRPYTVCGVKCFVHKDNDTEHKISHFDTGLLIARDYNFSQLIIIAKQRLSHPKAQESIEKGKKTVEDGGFTVPINK